LMFGRKEGAAVVARPAVSAGGSDRHEGWKVGVVAAETVGNPGAERRADEVVAAGVDHRHRLAVRLAAAVHGADDAQIIDFGGKVRKEFRHPEAGLAMLAKLPR